MLASFRRLSKSKVGTIVMALLLLAIIAGFAMQDIRNVVATGGAGMSQDTLAKVDSELVTDRELSDSLQRRLQQVRQERADADYSAIAGDFRPILDGLIRDAALRAFAARNDIFLSKLLVDAEIAKIPGTHGPNGKFSEQNYAFFLQQQRLTDAQLRKVLASALMERMMLAPASAFAKVPTGMARPYAAMLLEQREADAAIIPVGLFQARIGEPSDAALAAFYRANARRYLVPEQRILNLARIGPAQVAGVAPTEAEIATAYKAQQANYATSEQRVISQAVVPGKATADAIVTKLKGGTGFVDAAKPAGLSAADISVGPQTRPQFASLTSAPVAAAAFAAPAGGIVGPIKSDLGWHVIKIESIRSLAGKSLAEARGEIAAKLTAEKRKAALEDKVAKVEDSIQDGASFAEAAKAAGLTVIKTPLIDASGKSREPGGAALPADLAPALRDGFDLAADDDPVTTTLPGGAGYVVVGVDQIVAAAPAPLATIRPRVVADWKAGEARNQARAVAQGIADRVAKGMDVKAAVAASGVSGLPAPSHAALRRLQLSQMQGNVPPALTMMFSLAQGKSRMVFDPKQNGFAVVKTTKIVPGDPTLQVGLVTRLQSEFGEALSAEYADQFVRAIEADMKVKRNDKAIAAARSRIIGGGS